MGKTLTIPFSGRCSKMSLASKQVWPDEVLFHQIFGKFQASMVHLLPQHLDPARARYLSHSSHGNLAKVAKKGIWKQPGDFLGGKRVGVRISPAFFGWNLMGPLPFMQSKQKSRLEWIAKYSLTKRRMAHKMTDEIGKPDPEVRIIQVKQAMLKNTGTFYHPLDNQSPTGSIQPQMNDHQPAWVLATANMFSTPWCPERQKTRCDDS